MHVQVLSSFLVRPPPDSRFRKYWNTAHFWWGRILLAVALLNFFFGVFLAHSTPLYYIVPAAILLSWVLVGLVKVRTAAPVVPTSWKDYDFACK